MATEQEFTRASRVSGASSSVGCYSDEDYKDEEEEEEEEEEEMEETEKDEEEEEEPRVRVTCGGRRNGSPGSYNKWMMLGRILDPRSKLVQEWNRVFLLVCATGLFVDPLFLYTLSVNDACMCLLVDGWLALTVTALRSMTDLLHLWNILILFKIARRWPYPGGESDGDINKGDGTRVRTRVAPPYVKKNGFFFDLFVILPLPQQVVLWVVIPSLLKRGSVTLVVSILLLTFLFQYLPKIYHSIRHLRQNATLSGYIFGTVWWGIALNMVAYFVAAHAAGACWYLLGSKDQRNVLKNNVKTQWVAT
uniref:Ion transport domain-containing protein n=1 Tax=Brassica oleracea TaxID=3712 RepID=A0A3P6CSS0_BRAOL|nr:unnamed protein product [Brassica oleracea]